MFGRLRFSLLAVGLLAALLPEIGLVSTHEACMLSAEPRGLGPRPIPPMDRKVPDRLATATFALG